MLYEKYYFYLLTLIFFATICGEIFAADALTKADAPKIQVGDTWLYTKIVGTNVLGYNYKVTNSKKNPTDSNLFCATINSIVSEKITVKAGTFHTLKIDLEASYQGSRMGKPFKNKAVETYWYAPEVGRWVKRNCTDLGNPGLESLELISYQPAK